MLDGFGKFQNPQKYLASLIMGFGDVWSDPNDAFIDVERILELSLGLMAKRGLVEALDFGGKHGYRTEMSEEFPIHLHDA